MNKYQTILTKTRSNWERSRSQPLSREVVEARFKFYAEMMLINSDRLRIPSYEEWIGLNLLERDGKLERKNK